MITLTQRPLYTALASAGLLCATSIAQAVNVSADGRGQVLLYPYYTTRADGAGNAYATLLSVVNATASAKAVRVRFLEGRNGREVLDFNLFLSPFDVWTAAVAPDSTTGGGRIGTLDTSCTLPAFSASPTSPYVPFANFSYSGANDDGAGTGLDRAKEGYFEIIEMATYTSTSITGKAVTHANGMPPCGTPPIALPPPLGSPGVPITDAQAAMDAQPPSGGLLGTGTLINVNSGTDYSYDAVALANFYQIGSNYQGMGLPGSSLPDLTQASPPVSSIQAPSGALYESVWSTGTADAVSAVLMHESVINEYVLDTGTLSGTDWVVTMPTKRHYVGDGTGTATRLFQRNFGAGVGSCDDIDFYKKLWDRDETRPPVCGDPGVNCFDPPPPQQVGSMCWAANVVTLNTSNVLGSMNNANIPALAQNGWMSIGFSSVFNPAAANVHRLINTGATSITGGGLMPATGTTTTYVGLPTIGFAVVSYRNGTVQVGQPPTPVLSNYGGSFVHKTNTLIQ